VKLIEGLNSIDNRVWAFSLVVLGVVALAAHQKDASLMIIGGGLAIFQHKGPAQ
jgi:hypothetical protein